MIRAQLHNKTALVIGAASGIGFATAQILADNGCAFAMNDLPGNERLTQAVNVLLDKGYSVNAAPGDTGYKNSATNMVETAIMVV